MKLIIDYLAQDGLTLIEDDNEFAWLQGLTKHHVQHPGEFPALFMKHWYNDPNGPEGYEYTCVVSGSALQVIEDDDLNIEDDE
jgi:hypothetical protein